MSTQPQTDEAVVRKILGQVGHISQKTDALRLSPQAVSAMIELNSTLQQIGAKVPGFAQLASHTNGVLAAGAERTKPATSLGYENEGPRDPHATTTLGQPTVKSTAQHLNA